MEPRIQYAKTKDGVNIAFAMMGEGPVLVHQPWPQFSHLQLETGLARYKDWYGAIAERHTLVRYDRHGTGLSDRDVTDYSLEAQVADMEAVADRLALDRFALFGLFWLSPAAIVFAARRPDQVSHLILWNGTARGSDFIIPPRLDALMRLMETDWDLFAKSFALEVLGWEEPEAPEVVRLIKEGVEPDVWRQSLDAMQSYDAEDILSHVEAPTLVVHGIGNRQLDVSVAKGLASRIPNAHLSVQDGAGPPWRGDVESGLRTVLDFLGEDKRTAETRRTSPEGTDTAVILFLDIADSTALTTKLGDAAYRGKERELDATLRSAITDAGGTPVEGKVLGDGVMALFTSARQAIDAAVRCRDLGNEAGLPLHLGIHAGDVVREGNNVHGGAVQVASRVQSEAAPGEILVSDIVRGLARTSTDVRFEDSGEHELKGVEEPQRLFAVREEG